MNDPRTFIYKDLHSGMLVQHEPNARHSAEKVLEVLSAFVSLRSVLDVGCGLGVWLETALARGIAEIEGIEGPWLDLTRLRVDPARVQILDLEKGFDLGRRFDLVICLEVAEHLYESAADGFIDSLTRHAPLVLFSAAIPFQMGHHHVNERFLPYWVPFFARRGYELLDLVRPKIWDDPEVLVYIRQNVVLFAHESAIIGNERLRTAAEKKDDARLLSVVHPDYWVLRHNEFGAKVAELQRLTDYLKQGGMFQVTFGPKGEVIVTRVAAPPSVNPS